MCTVYSSVVGSAAIRSEGGYPVCKLCGGRCSDGSSDLPHQPQSPSLSFQSVSLEYDAAARNKI